jgi:phenylpropionate dioxygenase-like ring-hydroxylating dioxygenase large terminal subunit
LKKAVENGDAHNYKINEQKASLVRLAKLWEKRGEITKSDKEDIIWLATKSPNMLRWRPLIYLIPRSFSIDGRMRPVPAAKCAGLGREYIIQDLKESEFDIIEI